MYVSYVCICVYRYVCIYMHMCVYIYYLLEGDMFNEKKKL